MSDDKFQGWAEPKANYSKLPHQFFEMVKVIDTLAEERCVLYVLRHTWGFQEYGIYKKISLDEFVNGRKKRNKVTGQIERWDKGTGLSKKTVQRGLRAAVEHGLLEVVIDTKDGARARRYYRLAMKFADADQSLDPDGLTMGGKMTPIENQMGGEMTPIGASMGVKTTPRTEKETSSKKETTAPASGAAATFEKDGARFLMVNGVKKPVYQEGEPAQMALKGAQADGSNDNKPERVPSELESFIARRVSKKYLPDGMLHFLTDKVRIQGDATVYPSPEELDKQFANFRSWVSERTEYWYENKKDKGTEYLLRLIRRYDIGWLDRQQDGLRPETNTSTQPEEEPRDSIY